jgi:trehalose monomycolate/heme transporter
VRSEGEIFMLERWSRTVVAARRLTVAVALLVAAVGALWGTGVFSKLVTGGFEDPG